MPPSLTSEELRAIQEWERTHRSTVVRRLLWEVARLRSIALRADQYEQMTRRPGTDHALIGGILRAELEELPAVKEERARQDRLVNGHGLGKGRKSMGERAEEALEEYNKRKKPE